MGVVSKGGVSTYRGSVGITVGDVIIEPPAVRTGGGTGAGASGVDWLVHPAVKMIAIMRKATSIPQ
jgi:hypothetical protein